MTTQHDGATMPAETPHGEFLPNSQRATNLNQSQAYNLMTLAGMVVVDMPAYPGAMFR
jgi:hypothetical protein